MTAPDRPTYEALEARNAVLENALRVQALAPTVCLLCHSHRITFAALARIDEVLPLGGKP